MTTVNSIQPLTALHTLNKHSATESKIFNQLSTGKKINKASDDIIRSAKAQQLDKAIRSLDAAENNINTATSKLDTASGGLRITLENLQNLRELAVQAADDSLSLSQRRSVNQQANDSLQEIDRTSQAVRFDSQTLLDGSQENSSVQVGENAGDTKSISIESASVESLGLTEVDLSSADTATSSIDMLDSAIEEVSSRMTQMGGQSESLTQVASSNRERSNELSQSRSVTEDLDYALALGELKAIQIKKQSTSQTLSALLQSSQNVVAKLS